MSSGFFGHHVVTVFVVTMPCGHFFLILLFCIVNNVLKLFLYFIILLVFAVLYGYFVVTLLPRSHCRTQSVFSNQEWKMGLRGVIAGMWCRG